MEAQAAKDAQQILDPHVLKDKEALLEWGAADPAKCKAFRTKDCVAKRNHCKLVGRLRTHDQFPYQ